MRFMNKKILYFLVFFIVILFLIMLLINNNNNKDIYVNKPDLVNGIIPVYYDSINKIWRKSDITNKNNNWYDYSNGKWANAVMVRTEKSENKLSKSRLEYMTSSSNTVILYSDILAFYVWIPRFKYTIFNKEFKEIGEQIIEVNFEKGTSTTGTVDCTQEGVNFGSDIKSEACVDNIYGNIINGKSTYTHPAFTFGDIELNGIWVSKFETTGTSDFPTVLPNNVAITNQNISKQFEIALKFNSTNYIDFDAIKKVDIHMMKNIEWGAVAYLSQSEYGRCKNSVCNEIYQNNSISITGRSSGNSSGLVSTYANHYNLDDAIDNYSIFGYYTYDDRYVNSDGTVSNYVEDNLGSKSSTTENITGIYDMSGGSNEYTMAVSVYKDNNIISGADLLNNSGFNGVLINDDTIIYKNDGVELPLKKYYDLYSYNNSENSFVGSKLGDATGETRGWYSDMQCLVNESKSWSKRGCSYAGDKKAGLFYFCSMNGEELPHISFRTVMVQNRG